MVPMPSLRGRIDRRILVNYRLDGVELAIDEWGVTPLSVESVHASFFEERLPADAATFDNALLMTDVGHEWRSVPARPTAEGVPG